MTWKSGSSRVAPGKSSLHSSCEGELGIALESLQGKYTSSRVVSRNSVFLSSGNRDLGVEFKFHPVVSPRLEWEQRTPISSRVATGSSWSPLSVLKGVKLLWSLSEDLVLLSRPCRKRRASFRNDESLGFFELRRDLWGFSRY